MAQELLQQQKKVTIKALESYYDTIHNWDKQADIESEFYNRNPKKDRELKQRWLRKWNKKVYDGEQ